jgi:hypothetical protein
VYNKSEVITRRSTELNYQEKSNRTNNDLQNKTQKTKGERTRTTLKTKTQLYVVICVTAGKLDIKK